MSGSLGKQEMLPEHVLQASVSTALLINRHMLICIADQIGNS